MRRPVAGEVHVHYGQLYVESDPDGEFPDLAAAFAGQSAGLCGAAVPGALWLNTGLHTGNVGFVVEIHDRAPVLDPVWEDAVEVSYRPVSPRTRLVQWAGEASWELDLAVTDHRVRYCARGMDKGRKLDTRAAEEPQADRYLLQFWPAPPRPGQVLRETSESAAYWRRYARDLPPPPTPEQRAEAERRARWAEERAAEERRLHRERWKWGGRLPSEGLRGARESNVLGLLRFDSDLVHALDAGGPELQRAMALLAARRACEAAGLTGVPWVARALGELALGRPLPPPFDDPSRLWEALSTDPCVPDRSVLGAVPPERAPYRPPATPAEAGWTVGPAAEWQRLADEGARTGPGGIADDGARTGPGGAEETHVPVGLAGGWAAQAAGVGRGAVVGVRSSGDPRGPVAFSQPHLALPAVLAAAGPAPLTAALDAVWHAVHTCGDRYPELLREIRSACTERAGE